MNLLKALTWLKKINSRRFVQGILETFKESIDVYRPVGNFEEYHFDKEFLFNQLSENISRLNRIRRSQVHNVSSKDLALVILHRIKARLLNFRDGRSNSKKEMYLHMDILSRYKGGSITTTIIG